MKIAQLITTLQQMQEQHGNLDIYYKDNEYYMDFEVGGVEVDNSEAEPKFIIHDIDGEMQS